MDVLRDSMVSFCKLFVDLSKSFPAVLRLVLARQIVSLSPGAICSWKGA